MATKQELIREYQCKIIKLQKQIDIKKENLKGSSGWVMKYGWAIKRTINDDLETIQKYRNKIEKLERLIAKGHV